jgi:hypothetical protein
MAEPVCQRTEEGEVPAAEEAIQVVRQRQAGAAVVRGSDVESEPIAKTNVISTSNSKGGSLMSVKILVATTLALAIVTPAFAAEFYIVQNSATKHCTIVDKRPTSRTEVIVGENGKTYTTHEEADTAMKTVKVCEK